MTNTHTQRAGWLLQQPQPVGLLRRNGPPDDRSPSPGARQDDSTSISSLLRTHQSEITGRRRLTDSMDSFGSIGPRQINEASTLSPTPPPSYPQSPQIAAAARSSAVNRDPARMITSSSPRRRSSSSATSPSPQHPPSIKKEKKIFLRRKFRFRPKNVERLEKADSYRSKTAKFSNERTMLHWMNVTLNLGSMSMTLLSFGSNSVTPYVGVALLTVCLSMLIYSVTTFQVRMEWLNMRRDDVLYYDRWTPGIITLALFATFALNLASKNLSPLCSSQGPEEVYLFFYLVAI